VDFDPSGYTISSTHMGTVSGAAGVGLEDRKILLGHTSDHVTTHYSAPQWVH